MRRSIPQAAAEQLAALERELAELQQGEVLVSAHVYKTQIAAVIAEWTGVPSIASRKGSWTW
ncbi:hypothetical protein [Aeromonas molluscorum]|uniref:hypothetical protein n=1 Tax=Aeromonas molluscorum TaxID=271417 RepID=UPI003F1DE90F